MCLYICMCTGVVNIHGYTQYIHTCCVQYIFVCMLDILFTDRHVCTFTIEYWTAVSVDMLNCMRDNR